MLRQLPSPLARHPRLLVRKIFTRLRLRKELPPPAPPPLEMKYPPAWEPVLRAWMDKLALRPGPHPFNHVFGREWSEDLLLRVCRTGPDKTTPGLLADIKLAWDFSRAHPLVLNAATGTGLDASVAFLERWVQTVEGFTGPAWSCPMDIAIRAVNWIVADTLWHGELSQRFGARRWAELLWQHGWLIEDRLEARLASSNHYLADLLGLATIGAIFPQDDQARRWRNFVRNEFPSALLSQTHPDGGLAEASLRYHAFVTEMALLTRLFQEARFPYAAADRLQAMCRIVAECQDASGDVFALGDDDSGRVLALDHASVLGRARIVHQLGAALVGPTMGSSRSALFPQSGWWIGREGKFLLAFEFGGVGLGGMGSHAHNDDLSFCLGWSGRSVIVDPGTGIYTGDRAARDRFRSTAAHNTLMIDGQEQRSLSTDPFILRGPEAALSHRSAGPGKLSAVRRAGDGLEHERALAITPGGICIQDAVRGTGVHELRWQFHLHPDVRARVEGSRFLLDVPGAGVLELACDQNPQLRIEAGEYSPEYGRILGTQVCQAILETELPVTVSWQLRAV